MNKQRECITSPTNNPKESPKSPHKHSHRLSTHNTTLIPDQYTTPPKYPTSHLDSHIIPNRSQFQNKDVHKSEKNPGKKTEKSMDTLQSHHVSHLTHKTSPQSSTHTFSQTLQQTFHIHPYSTHINVDTPQPPLRLLTDTLLTLCARTTHTPPTWGVYKGINSS